jgi:hypothetical protein
VAFRQPDDQWPEYVAGKMEENAQQRAGVTQNVPRTYTGKCLGARRQGRG